MIYIKTILDLTDDVIGKVYIAMKENPLTENWFQKVATDF